MFPYKKTLKSVKTIYNEGQTKKVHLMVSESKNSIEHDLELEEQGNMEKSDKRRKIQIVKVSGSSKARSCRALRSRQKNNGTRSCLKKEGSHRSIAGDSELDLKSTKSIKFNTTNKQIFEYQTNQKTSRKKIRSHKFITTNREKVDQQCCIIY